MARLWFVAVLFLSAAAAAQSPADAPPPIKRLDEAAALSGLAIRMEALAEVDQFSGAFLVARHDKVLLQQAYGLANRETETANTLDTRFCYASAGKMFTGSPGR